MMDAREPDCVPENSRRGTARRVDAAELIGPFLGKARVISAPTLAGDEAMRDGVRHARRRRHPDDEQIQRSEQARLNRVTEFGRAVLGAYGAPSVVLACPEDERAEAHGFAAVLELDHESLTLVFDAPHLARQKENREVGRAERVLR